MIVRNDIVQGTDEWHQIKWGKIGGTRAHGLLVDTDTLLTELLVEHTEEYAFGESFMSEDMLRGMDLESVAREALSKYCGIDFIQVGWLQSEESDLIGLSPDGMSECMRYSAEIKCPAGKRHMDTLRSQQIPRDNIRQSIHYFTVNPLLEKHFFCSFRPEAIKQIFVREINRSTPVDVGLTHKIKVKRPNPKGAMYEYTETVPLIKTAGEWAKICLDMAKQLSIDIGSEIDRINF